MTDTPKTLTIVDLDTLSMRTEEHISPGALLALGEVVNDCQERNRPVVADLLADTIAFGSGAIFIDGEGTAHAVKDWQEK